jgi:outer membrane immunogenic protein
MRRACWMVLAATLAAPGAAVGADLPQKKAAPEPPPPVFSWQGGYAGVYAGALLGEGVFGLGVTAPLRTSTFVGGGTLGYNWQWTPQIVLGLEADVGYRGELRAPSTVALIPGPVDSGVLGTLRGRAGYVFAPRWLAYATGGFSYGTNFAPRSFATPLLNGYGSNAAGATTRIGWAAGAGVEYAVNDRVSVKAEYLYIGLTNQLVGYTTTFGAVTANVASSGHVLRGGLNYRFGANDAGAVVTK